MNNEAEHFSPLFGLWKSGLCFYVVKESKTLTVQKEWQQDVTMCAGTLFMTHII